MSGISKSSFKASAGSSSDICLDDESSVEVVSAVRVSGDKELESTHPVVPEKVFASGSDELVLTWMVHHFVPNDAGCGMRPVLVSVMLKILSNSIGKACFE